MNEMLKKIDLGNLKDRKILSTRAYNICCYSNLYSLNDLISFYDENKTFLKLKKCGKKTNKELITVYNKYNKIKQKDLESEYYKAALTKYFPKLYLTRIDFFSETGKIQLFKFINELLDNHLIFDERELIIFKIAFNYFIDFEKIQMKETAQLVNLSKGRTRIKQIAIYDKLNTFFKFITTLDIDSVTLYDIDINSDLISIKDETVNKINTEEKTNFNKLFINKIVSILKKQTHSLIGRERDLIFKFNQQFNYAWESTYIISKQITEIFDFESFAYDVSNRLNKRIIKTYSYRFQTYLHTFFKPKEYKKIDRISNICEKILNNEFNLVLDSDKNIVFQKNAKIKNPEIIREILQDAQEPMDFKEIHKRCIEKYPNSKITVLSIGKTLRSNTKFIYLGQCNYCLKEWKNKYFKTEEVSIRNIAENFLQQFSEPKHINEITEYVCQFRDTYIRSIINNLKREKNNRFVFFENRLIGLKSKKYDKLIE